MFPVPGFGPVGQCFPAKLQIFLRFLQITSDLFGDTFPLVGDTRLFSLDSLQAFQTFF